MEGRGGPERDKTADGQCPHGGAGAGDAGRSKGRGAGDAGRSKGRGAGDAGRSKGRILEAVIGDEEEAWEAGAKTGCGAPGGGAGTRAEPSYSGRSGQGGRL